MYKATTLTQKHNQPNQQTNPQSKVIICNIYISNGYVKCSVKCVQLRMMI